MRWSAQNKSHAGGRTGEEKEEKATDRNVREQIALSNRILRRTSCATIYSWTKSSPTMRCSRHECRGKLTQMLSTVGRKSRKCSDQRWDHLQVNKEATNRRKPTLISFLRRLQRTKTKTCFVDTFAMYESEEEARREIVQIKKRPIVAPLSISLVADRMKKMRKMMALWSIWLIKLIIHCETGRHMVARAHFLID